MKKGKYLKQNRPKQSRPNPGLTPVPAPKHKPQKLTKAQRATNRFTQHVARMLLAMLAAVIIGCTQLAHPALIGLIVIGLLVDLAVSYTHYANK